MRIRTIKPAFFTHEGIFEAEKEFNLPLRLAFIGLWCACDREGRFKWEPRRLGIQIIPYDGIDFSRVLDALATRGFIRQYRVGDATFGCIPSWNKHQVINNRETQSDLPGPVDNEGVDASGTREPRVDHARKAEGKGREGNMEGNLSPQPLPQTPAVEPPLSDKERESLNFVPEPEVRQIRDWANDPGPDFGPDGKPALIEACISAYPSRAGKVQNARNALTAKSLEELMQIKSALDELREFYNGLQDDQHRYLPGIHNYFVNDQYLIPPHKIFRTAPRQPQLNELTDAQKRRLEAENERIERVAREQEETAKQDWARMRERAAWMRQDEATRSQFPPYATPEEIELYGHH